VKEKESIKRPHPLFPVEAGWGMCDRSPAPPPPLRPRVPARSQERGSSLGRWDMAVCLVGEGCVKEVRGGGEGGKRGGDAVRARDLGTAFSIGGLSGGFF
jgi:hypothetical protein